MGFSTEVLLSFVEFADLNVGYGSPITVLGYHSPEAPEKTVGPFNAGVRPFEALFWGGSEHTEKSYGISAITIYQLLRVNRIAFGF